MNRNKRIILLTFMILALTYSLFGLSLMKEANKLPDSNWSRQIEIAYIGDCDIHEVRNHNSIVSVPLVDRHEVMTLYWKDQLRYSVATLGGEFLGEGTVEVFSDKMDRLELFKRNEGSLILYALSGGVLSSIELDTDTMDVVSKIDLMEDVRTFEASNEVVVVRKEKAFQVLTPLNAVKIPFEDLENFEVFGLGDESFLVYTDVLEDQKRHLRMARINNESCAYELTDLDVFANTSFIRTRSIGLQIENSQLYVVYENEDYRTGESSMVLYSGRKAEPLTFERSSMQAFDRVTAPDILEITPEGIALAVTVPQVKGNDKVVENIVRAKYTVGQDGLELGQHWTRTDQKSTLLSVFKDDSNQYITWIDEGNSDKRIYLAGDSIELIHASQKWTSDEVSNTAMILLFSLMPILFATLFPTAAVIGPIVLCLFLGSIKHLTWLENNSRKVVWGTVGIHFIIKLGLTFRSIITESLIENIESHFPKYLSNPLYLTLVLLVTTAIAYGATQWRLKDASKDEFWGLYIQFALTDMLMYGLLIMPYYYSYVGWGLFY